ncbi:MAG: DUF1972 domain-containing protein [Bacteroidia bacterium]
MKVGIIGTRGIPNQYGGFEQFAEYFSTLFVEKGHEVSVYTSHNHPFTGKYYKGVKIIRCYDPEFKLGTAGQFIYDFNCILNSRKQNFDIILQLGYTSSTIWSWLYPKKPVLVTNMDGLEWKRSKYNGITQQFLKRAEKWGVKFSNYLIADSKGIQEYLKEKYNTDAVYVPYGAELCDINKAENDILSTLNLAPENYDLLIARFEPENNIEIILNAYIEYEKNTLVLIGNHQNTAFGKRMFKKYSTYKNIVFAGAIYNLQSLNSLRKNCRLYLHGHSVGGTNPSLLEAMACHTIVCAHDNIFNRHVLNEEAFYFKTAKDIINLLAQPINKNQYETWQVSNAKKLENEYNWQIIVSQLENYFKKWLNEKQN